MNCQAREWLIGLSASYLEQIVPEFVSEIGPTETVITALVQITDIPRVSAIAAPKMLGSAFKQQDLNTDFPCGHCSTECGIAPTND